MSSSDDTTRVPGSSTIVKQGKAGERALRQPSPHAGVGFYALSVEIPSRRTIQVDRVAVTRPVGPARRVARNQTGGNAMTPPSSYPLRRELAVYALIAVSAVCVYLLRYNRQLAAQVDVVARQAKEPRPGLFVPPYRVQTIAGDSVELGLAGRRQLLFFFRTTCEYCRASLPAWKEISKGLQNDTAIAIYGVALDSVAPAQAYATDNALPFPVISGPDPRLVAYFRINGVPAVVLVNENGRMAYGRLGPMTTRGVIDSVLAAARRPILNAAGQP